MDDRGHFSVYSTPVIADLFSDGHKEIIVPSFVHYLEVLEGEDGAKAGGEWPAFHKSTAHASPLVHDSGAGAHILLPTYDGEVLFFDDSGARLAKTLRVPPFACVATGTRVSTRPRRPRPSRRRRRRGRPRELSQRIPRAGYSAGEPSAGRQRAGLEAQRRHAVSGRSTESRSNLRRRPDDPRRRRLLEDAPGADPGGHTLTEEAAETFSVFDDLKDENDYDEVVGGPHFGEVVDGEGARDEREADREFWAGTDGEDEDVAEAEVEAEEVAQTGDAMSGYSAR